MNSELQPQPAKWTEGKNAYVDGDGRPYLDILCNGKRITSGPELTVRAVIAAHNAALDKHDAEVLSEVVQLLASIFIGNRSLLGGSPPPMWTPHLIAQVADRNLKEHDAEVRAATLKQYCEDEGYSFSHCAIHDTYPVPNEPCWQCINQATKAREVKRPIIEFHGDQNLSKEDPPNE